MFHLDVMDGHFVPNLTMGPDLVRAVRRVTDRTLEAHLMLERPDRYFRQFLSAGADILLLHYESPVDLKGTMEAIRNEGGRCGIVVNPETDVSKAFPFLEHCEILLVMSVHPGFSGQSFIPSSLENVKKARRYIDEHGLGVEIEIDGGINDRTARMAIEAGADILVSASYIFGGNVKERIRALRSVTASQ